MNLLVLDPASAHETVSYVHYVSHSVVGFYYNSKDASTRGHWHIKRDDFINADNRNNTLTVTVYQGHTTSFDWCKTITVKMEPATTLSAETGRPMGRNY